MRSLLKRIGLEWCVTYDDYLVIKIGNTVKLIPMWKLTIDSMLKKLSLRPYKTFKLKTGVIVKHYQNGRITVQPRVDRQG